MDLTSPKTVKSIAEKFNFGFSKGLGQNFLLDAGVLDKIAESAEIEKGVLEIGPGFGTLTRRLAEEGGKVTAVEVDRRLIPVLEYTLADFDNVTVLERDILKTDIRKLIDDEFGGGPVSVAANLPYYITTPIITYLLESRLPLKNIVVMVQKEVAQRLAAKPGGKEYGAISVMCRYYTEPEIITEVPAASFYPAPKVDSAVLRLAMLDKPRVNPKDEKLFFRVVKAAFAQRRKTLLNCLTSAFSADKQQIASKLEDIGIDPGIRGEKLGVEEFKKISDALIG